jgi:hypothetical protein
VLGFCVGVQLTWSTCTESKNTCQCGCHVPVSLEQSVANKGLCLVLLLFCCVYCFCASTLMCCHCMPAIRSRLPGRKSAATRAAPLPFFHCCRHCGYCYWCRRSETNLEACLPAAAVAACVHKGVLGAGMGEGGDCTQTLRWQGSPC